MQFINDFMTKIIARIQDAKEEAGQTLVEYGLIIALIAVVAIAGLVLLGPTLRDVFTGINDDIAPAAT